MLKIDLQRDGRTLTMQVLEQSGIERGCGDVCEFGGWSLLSESYPQIDGPSRVVITLGTLETNESNRVTETFSTSAEAITAQTAIKRLIAHHNATESDATPEATTDTSETPDASKGQFHPFWMVMGSGGTASKRHDTKQEAIDEASRLAEMEHDRFWIVEAIGYVEPIEPTPLQRVGRLSGGTP